MRHSHSNVLFWSVIVTSAAILSQMFVYILEMAFTFLAFKANIFQICSTWLEAVGFHDAVYVLDGLAIWTLTSLFILTCDQFRLLISSRRSLLPLLNDHKTGELRQSFGISNLIVIDVETPTAFTFGLTRPAIVLSTGLIALLDEDELASVVHHERFHQITYDPLRSFIFGILASVLWFLPIMKWQYKHYRIAREVLADQYAISIAGSERGVASALLKLIKARKNWIAVAQASFADTSINYRIQRLLNPREDIMPSAPRLPMFISVASGMLLIAIYGIGIF